MGKDAVVKNSLIYNGCKIGGTVRNSILYPGVHVKKGAVVENSILFFNNIVGEKCRINKVVSDVNNTFEAGVVAGPAVCEEHTPVTAIGWQNTIPENTVIGEGAVIHPSRTGDWPNTIHAGEELR